MEDVTGGCRCGAVRVTAVGEPNRVGLCHCMDCRKHHGAVFHASAVFPLQAVTVTGVTNSYAERFFCPICGSPVFSCSDDEIEIHLGTLDTPDQMRPTYELWTVHRESWLPDLAETTKYKHNRDGLALVEDKTPNS